MGFRCENRCRVGSISRSEIFLRGLCGDEEGGPGRRLLDDADAPHDAGPVRRSDAA